MGRAASEARVIGSGEPARGFREGQLGSPTVVLQDAAEALRAHHGVGIGRHSHMLRASIPLRLRANPDDRVSGLDEVGLACGWDGVSGAAGRS